MSRPSRGLRWVLTLHCVDASELASIELDEPLSLLEAVALRGHLLACGSCRRFRRQLRWIREAARLRDRSPVGPNPGDDALSHEARERILRAIDEAGRDGL